MFPTTIRAFARAALRVAPLALLALAIGGCANAPTWRSFGVYKIDINQGNYLSQDMVDKLKPGMTPQQVKQILGSPLVDSPFRPDRWDYVYQYSRQGQVVEQRKFTAYFADGKLTRWEGDVLPASVVELNKSASAKALPSDIAEDKGFWDRVLDVFRK